MTPTLIGRIQTRILVILLVGVPWTLVFGFLIPADRGSQGRLEALGSLYQHMFLAILVVLILGVVIWDSVWHFLQQYRWENDWPILFALLVVVPEGILAYVALRLIGLETDEVSVGFGGFAAHILTTWFLMWSFLIGPIRAVLIRYRFRGGRVI